MPLDLRRSEAAGVESPIAVLPVRNCIQPGSCCGEPLHVSRVRQPWLVGTEELTAAWVAADVFVLSRPRRLALGAVLGVALLLPIAPLVLAAWSVLDGSALDRTIGRFDQISHIAVLVQLGRLPLFLVLATLLARSPKEQ